MYVSRRYLAEKFKILQYSLICCLDINKDDPEHTDSVSQEDVERCRADIIYACKAILKEIGG